MTTGDVGPTGDQGVVGDQGAEGERGHAGDQGVQGVQGIQGVRGLKGPQGDQGLPVALTGFADSQAKLAEAVADLVRIIAEQTERIAELTGLLRRITRRMMWERVVAAVVVGLLMVASGLLLSNSFANRDTLAIVQSATDPDGDIAQRGQEAQAGVVSALLDEGDCRTRRAMAGLSSPDPAKSCRDQTPADVFPGKP